MFVDLNKNRMKKHVEQQKEQFTKNILYRTNMRRMEQSQRDVTQVMESYRRRAVEAERSGQHQQAVKFAMEAERMRRRLSSSESMMNTVETAHAMSETSGAILRIMECSNELIGAVGGMADPIQLYEAQIGLDATQEQICLMTEQQNEMMNDFLLERDEPDSDGEDALRMLMKRSPESRNGQACHTEARRMSTLKEANRWLDELHPMTEADKK